MLIELRTFRLAAGVDEATFLRADAQVQAWLSSRASFVRRTTARGGYDDRWLALTFWDDTAHADASEVREHGAAAAFDALVDPGSVRIERFESLGS